MKETLKISLVASKAHLLQTRYGLVCHHGPHITLSNPEAGRQNTLAYTEQSRAGKSTIIIMLNLRWTRPMHIWIMDVCRQRKPDTARKELTVFEFVSSHFLLDNYASVSSSQTVATLVRVPPCSAVSLCYSDSLSSVSLAFAPCPRWVLVDVGTFCLGSALAR